MEQERLTFNDMPEALAIVLSKLEILGDKVDKLMPRIEPKEERQWLNVAELCAYLPSHPREQTVYSWTCAHRIPFHKKGRSIMFDKNEIDRWLLTGHSYKSEEQLEQEAQQFISNKRVFKIK